MFAAFKSPCRIQIDPDNGYLSQFIDFNITRPTQFDDVIDHLGVLRQSCNENYAAISTAVNICIDGKWGYGGGPDCRLNCHPSRLINPTNRILCYQNGIEIDCQKPVRKDTFVRIKCKKGYKNAVQSERNHMATCQADGSWTLMPEPCIPGDEPPNNNAAGSCRIGGIPEHGSVEHFVDFNVTKPVNLNDVVENYGTIRYKCPSSYSQLYGSAVNFCLNGQWTQYLPSCHQPCSASEINEPTLKAACFENGKESHCRGPINPSTFSIIWCKRGYRNAEDPIQRSYCQFDGQWSPRPQPCILDDVKQVVPENSCRLTDIPINGYVSSIESQTIRINVNDIVGNLGQIQYSCIENHYVIGNATNVCYGGQWLYGMPECQPRCNPREVSSITYLANCRANGKEISCTEPATPGTVARINCQRGYNSVTPEQQQVLSCRTDGRWFPPVQPCVQICGREGPDGTPYIVGGHVTNITKIPWHVGIYRKLHGDFQQQCGGTIINPKVVISAAHCFWNLQERKVNPAKEYRVSAGKVYRAYDDPRETNTFQTFAVDRVQIWDKYEDFDGNYEFDIAIVILNQFIEFRVHIAPICIEYNYDLEERSVPTDWVGRVAGWGLEESGGAPSSVLKIIEIPVISRNVCKESFKNSNVFVTGDKFCAGFRDMGIGLCQGDSGGGLVFPKVVNGKNVYFIRGIVSNGPSSMGSCDSNQYTAFTNTAHFSDFIFENEFRERPH